MTRLTLRQTVRNRTQAAWAALRGYPVAYRVEILGGFLVMPKGYPRAVVSECTFAGSKLLSGDALVDPTDLPGPRGTQR